MLPGGKDAAGHLLAWHLQAGRFLELLALMNEGNAALCHRIAFANIAGSLAQRFLVFSTWSSKQSQQR